MAGGRLHWKVRLGKVQPGVEISWEVETAHGTMKVRIQRLSDAPSEVRKVRITCKINGSPQILSIAVDNDMQLAVVLEGTDAPPRTVAVKSSSVSELVIRQLSDRERDPVFQESMAVAEVFARTVLE